MRSKIKNKKQLKAIVSSLKRKGKRIAFTNGCFDIIHYGHIKYLQEAKALAEVLIVAVNDDNSVKRLKGKERPIFSLKDRMRVLQALESVDYVTSFSEDTPAEIIKYLRPDMVVKGGDYKTGDIIGKDIVKSYGGSVKSVSYLKGYSVSSLIKKIKGSL